MITKDKQKKSSCRRILTCLLLLFAGGSDLMNFLRTFFFVSRLIVDLIKPYYILTHINHRRGENSMATLPEPQWH